MAQLERIGISLDAALLSMFDGLIQKQGYQNRSEALRDLIRRQLAARHLENPKAKAIAAVFLVYDHHSSHLMEKLVALQHSNLLQTICSMHIHISAHDCMEVIILHGRVEQINKTAENMISRKGVKFGRVNLITTDSHY